MSRFKQKFPDILFTLGCIITISSVIPLWITKYITRYPDRYLDKSWQWDDLQAIKVLGMRIAIGMIVTGLLCIAGAAYIDRKQRK